MDGGEKTVIAHGRKKRSWFFFFFRFCSRKITYLFLKKTNAKQSRFGGAENRSRVPAADRRPPRRRRPVSVRFALARREQHNRTGKQ